MHYFIYPTKDTWISSGSRKTDGLSFTEQNFGQDEIIELKKEFYNLTFDYPTRMLIQFDLTEVSKSIENLQSTNEQITPNVTDNVGSKFYLRLYEGEGNKELSSNYGITVHPISESWDEGRGKFGSSPQIKDGASWNYRKWPEGGSGISWNGGLFGSGSSYISSSGAGHVGSNTGLVNAPGTLWASQNFSSSKPDIEVDVTSMTIAMLSSSQVSTADDAESDMTKRLRNNGMMVRFTGSQETDSETFAHLKFFSSDTNTIYSPKLEFRWDDHIPATGSNTGSLLQMTSSGETENYVYQIGNRYEYREDEKIKFRFGIRDRYIQKTFSRSVQEISGSYIPFRSGSYSIVDIATGETKVPFSNYTTMSCDSTSNYFNQWLNGFETDRIYKILIKINYDDGQEKIFDNDFEFKIKR